MKNVVMPEGFPETPPADLESKRAEDWYGMKVLELVGTRVWIRSDPFRKISGIISSVLKPVNRDDLRSSIGESLFNIVLHSGEVIQLLGSEICQVDYISEPVLR